MIDEKIKEEIINRIKAQKPYKVFLFGSHAYGNSNADSDIDLLVVLDKETPSKNFKERSENFLKISRAIRDIERKIPIDLIVYTKSEFEDFVNLGSLFSKKILNEGEVIL